MDFGHAISVLFIIIGILLIIFGKKLNMMTLRIYYPDYKKNQNRFLVKVWLRWFTYLNWLIGVVVIVIGIYMIYSNL